MNTTPGNITPDAPQSEVNAGLIQLHKNCDSLAKTADILIRALTPVLSPDCPKEAQNSNGTPVPECPVFCPVRTKLDDSTDILRDLERRLNQTISRLAV